MEKEHCLNNELRNHKIYIFIVILYSIKIYILQNKTIKHAYCQYLIKQIKTKILMGNLLQAFDTHEY